MYEYLCGVCDEPATVTRQVSSPKRIPDWIGSSTKNYCQRHDDERRAGLAAFVADIKAAKALGQMPDGSPE